MKFLKKPLAALLSAALLCSPALAITEDGQNQTEFDGIWEIVQQYGLIAEKNPYILQNYINFYLENHPDERYQVISDILAQMDSHSMYVPAEQYSEGFGALEGYAGIGISIAIQGEDLVIGEVFAGSPAEKAGVKVGDILRAVDGISTEGLSPSALSLLIRGKPDTEVVLTIEREGQTLEISCTRAQVNRTYVSGEMLPSELAYLRILAFGSEQDKAAFDQLWQRLLPQNPRAIILDLRGNGGGVVDVSLHIAGLLTPTADTLLAGVQWREDQGGFQPAYSEEKPEGYTLPPVYVLVDGHTASAAELLSGSLQDNGFATLIGTQTFGKAQGQYHLPMANGDKLILTTLELKLPQSDQSWEGVGLTPDKVVENPSVLVDYAALPPLDLAAPLYYGQADARTAALAERLKLLGLPCEADGSFGPLMLFSVQTLYQDYGRIPRLYASAELLSLLDSTIKEYDGQQVTVDAQLKTAFELALSAQSE